MYIYENVPKPWYGARGRCEELMGDLVSVISPQDESIVNSLTDYSLVWIGIQGTGSNLSHYKFIDGQDISTDSWATDHQDLTGEKQCGSYRNEEIKLYPCTSNLTIFCKVGIMDNIDTVRRHLDKHLGDNRTEEAAKLLSTSMIGMIHSIESSIAENQKIKVDAQLSSDNSSIYILDKSTERNWDDSRARCKEMLGDLITDISLDDMTRIKAMKDRKLLWIGVYGVGSDKNDYRFLDGKAIDNPLWSYDQPRTASKTARCALLGRGGKWWAFKCSIGEWTKYRHTKPRQDITLTVKTLADKTLTTQVMGQNPDGQALTFLEAFLSHLSQLFPESLIVRIETWLTIYVKKYSQTKIK